MPDQQAFAAAQPQPQPPHQHANRRWVRWVIAGLILAVAAWWAFGGEADKPDKKAGRGGAPVPVVSLAAVGLADIPVYLDGLGTIQAFNNVTIRAQVSGQLLRVNFTEGQEVKAGELLAEIDPRLFQAAYDQAQANLRRDTAQLENTKRDLRRYADLGTAIAQQTVDTQRAAVRQAEATVAADRASAASAKTQLDFTLIKAPFAGRTGIRQIDVGNIVAPGDANGIVTITQVQPISVVFSLPQQALPQLVAAQAKGPVTVLAVDADKKVLDTGVLILVDNQVDPATGTVRLRATLPNQQRALWPGAFTNVRLLADVMAGALYVPSAAIQRGPDSTYVFVFNPADHTVRMQPVEVRLTEAQVAVITKGLNEGDQIVTDNGGKLSDGDTVALPGEPTQPNKPPGKSSGKPSSKPAGKPDTP